MQDYFQDKKKLCSIQDKPQETIVFKRISRSNSRFTQNYIFECLLQDDTKIVNGDTITDNEGHQYFAVARRDSYLSKTAQLFKVNCSVSIVRLKKEFINGTFTGKYVEQQLHANIPSMYQDISGNARQYDPGILSTSTRKFILPKLADIQLLDRIKFNGEKMQIDSINTSTYEGLLYIQCQPDVTK